MNNLRVLSKSIKNDLERLLKKNFHEIIDLSFDVIIESLKEKEVNYIIQENDEVRNIIVDLKEFNLNETESKYVVLGAHYDIWPGSKGYNDNISSVSLLLAFIDYVVENNVNENIMIVFFDKEEQGMKGSNLFVKVFKNKIDYALIFDIVGFGDYIVSCKSPINSELQFEEHDILSLSLNLPSDNISFDRHKIKNNLLVSLPKEDLIFKNDFEVDLKPNHMFHKSFHNGKYDNQIHLLTWETILFALEFLIKKYIINKGEKDDIKNFV